MSFDRLVRLHDHECEHHPNMRRCSECGVKTHSTGELEWHALRTGHGALLCPQDGCDSTFSRFDVMRRHYLNHAADVQRYPCPHCKKYRGKNGFKRKDHLTQHLRGYHHIGEVENIEFIFEKSCPHGDCFAYRGSVNRDGQCWPETIETETRLGFSFMFQHRA